MVLPKVIEKGHKMNRQDLKRRSSNSLRGHYLPLVLSYIIVILLGLSCFLIGKIINDQPLSWILGIILLGLFSMGLIQIIIKTARNEKTDFKDFFTRTDLFFKALGISLIYYIIFITFYLLEFIAINSLSVFMDYQTDLNFLLSSFMIVIGFALSLAIPLFFIILLICFSQSYFILYDNNNMHIIDIFKKSMNMIEGYKNDYILLVLSFTGWLILGIFTFNILYLWLFPYTAVTLANFYDEIKK